MITGDTTTDEQIRELREGTQRQISSMTVAIATYDQYTKLTSIVFSALVALGERRARRGGSRAKARARCAEILNARVAEVSRG